MSRVDIVEIVKDGVIKITHENVPVELPFELVIHAAYLIREQYGDRTKIKINLEKEEKIKKVTKEILEESINQLKEQEETLIDGFGPAIELLTKNIVEFVIEEVDRR